MITLFLVILTSLGFQSKSSAQSLADSLFFGVNDYLSVFERIEFYQDQQKHLTTKNDSSSSALLVTHLKLGLFFNKLGSSLISQKHFTQAKGILVKHKTHYNQFLNSMCQGELLLIESETDTDTINTQKKYQKMVESYNNAAYIYKTYLEKEKNTIWNHQYKMEIFNRLALGLYKAKDTTLSKSYIDKALHYAQISDVKRDQAIIYSNLIFLTSDLNKKKDYAQRSLNLLKQIKAKENYAEIFNHMAEIHLTKKNTQTAKIYVDSARHYEAQLYKENGENPKNLNDIISTMNLDSKIAFLEGNHQKAYNGLQGVFNFEFQNKLVEQKRLTAELEKLFKIEENEMILSNEKQAKNFYSKGLWFSVIGGSFTVFLLVFLLKKMKSDHVNKRKINQLQLENSELTAQQLKKDIALKDRNLKDFATDITIKHDFAERIHEELTALNKTDNKDILKELLVYSRNEIDRNNNAKILWENMDKVNYEFFNKLKQYHPSLTQKDLQFCALIHLNLTNKEIAAIKRTTDGYITTKKYKLKTRLGVPKEQKFRDFLIEFMNRTS